MAEDPTSTVKNLVLAKVAVCLIGDEKIKLNIISGKKYAELPYYYGAADVLMLTSLSEGSPNVIDVGRWLAIGPIVVTVM